MKRYIYAMALDKQSLIQELSGVSGKLIEHLIKLYLFPNSDTKNHWRKEVWNLLHQVPKLKSSKKFPSNRMIRDIIGAYDDMTKELANMIIEEYPDLNPYRTDYDELASIVNNYLDWISDVLSTKGVVSSSEVYAELDELGLSMENSKYDINEIKDKLVKAAEDFSKEYTFKPSAEDNKNIVSVRLKDVLSKEVYDDILRRYTMPIQTFDIYVEPPKRESNPDKQ